VQSFLEEFKQLVTEASPTHIVHLGDLVDFSAYPAGTGIITAIMDEIEKWRIPTWILSGNHDWVFFRELPQSRRRYVQWSMNQAMRLEIPGPTPTKVFLGHDVGQPYKVRGDDVVPYLGQLKRGFPAVFKENDWLVTGHCHTLGLSTASRVACVGQFAPEAGVRAYGVLSIGDEVCLELQDERGGFGALL
jgi:predicted phosphodiesterase